MGHFHVLNHAWSGKVWASPFWSTPWDSPTILAQGALPVVQPVGRSQTPWRATNLAVSSWRWTKWLTKEMRGMVFKETRAGAPVLKHIWSWTKTKSEGNQRVAWFKPHCSRGSPCCAERTGSDPMLLERKIVDRYCHSTWLGSYRKPGVNKKAMQRDAQWIWNCYRQL